ncbi:MAG: S8 family peptidase [Bacteroidota bacterium]|nr:S8 family peptidase [Bacteroidota bacterium]
MKQTFLLIALFTATSLFAQKKQTENWFTLDPVKDKIYGTGADEAYKILKDKQAKPVIVAVIDSGVDPDHEDLKEVIWINALEIPGNDVDDDKNGYVDDVNGWSFLGGKNGDINYEATELARMYQKLNKKYSGLDPSSLSGKDEKEYQEYIKIKTDFITEQTKQEQQVQGITIFSGYLDKVKSRNNGVLDKKAFKNYTPENEFEKEINKKLKVAFALGLISPTELETQIAMGKDQLENMLKNNKLNADSIRTYMVGDNVNDPNERFYGNNHVQGPDALHGTHVAGIIAAVRNNNLGIKGVADHVKIMILRAVPNGDERDKDIANAIRYAVDNGATIINMSFGKYYSPDKAVVDEAVKYAQSKDVLLIHAAGNDSKDNDLELSFPSRELSSGELAGNWIQVGATSAKKGKNLIGSFSNYGKTKVDLFAPGVDIYSTVPGNKYLNESGTSMACPSTAGVAAIIRSYFPELKAEEVKAVLMRTVVTYKKDVVIPGTEKEKKNLKDLSVSGGVVNANNAVKELMGLNKKK